MITKSGIGSAASSPATLKFLYLFLEDSPIGMPENQQRPSNSPTTLFSPHKNETFTQEGRSVRTAEASASPSTYGSTTAEAKACPRNLETCIKTEVTNAIERLYQLVKDAEEERSEVGISSSRKEMGEEEKTEQRTGMGEELVRKLEKQAGLIRRNEEKMEELRQALEKQRIAREDYIRECGGLQNQKA